MLKIYVDASLAILGTPRVNVERIEELNHINLDHINKMAKRALVGFKDLGGVYCPWPLVVGVLSAIEYSDEVSGKKELPQLSLLFLE